MNLKISRRYSTALFDAAVKADKLDIIVNDVNSIIYLLISSRKLTLFFRSPVIKSEIKSKIVTELFKDRVDKLSCDFIFLLIQNKRESLIKSILEDFIALVKEKLGILDISIKTAIELDDKEKQKIINVMENYTKKKIEPAFLVDKNIIGGFTAQIQDSILDASIKTQLVNLGKKLKSSNLNI